LSDCGTFNSILEMHCEQSLNSHTYVVQVYISSKKSNCHEIPDITHIDITMPCQIVGSFVSGSEMGEMKAKGSNCAY
jgi:hypothetical protein